MNSIKKIQILEKLLEKASNHGDETTRSVLAWAIEELSFKFCKPVVMIVGTNNNFENLDFSMHVEGPLTALIGIELSAAETAFLRKRFVPPNAQGVPLSMVVDLFIGTEFFPTVDKVDSSKRAIYLEGLISTEQMQEIGRKEVERLLAQWLCRFYTLHR